MGRDLNGMLLYLGVVLGWGLAPIFVAAQVDVAAAETVVGYRFAVAAALLLGWCRWRGLTLGFGVRDHLFLALQGVLMCSLNEIMLYEGVARAPVSGLVPLVYTLLTVMNVLVGAVFLGLAIRPRVVVGAAMGIGGVAMVFWRDLAGLDLSSAALAGLGFALAATVFASFGNIAAARNQGTGLPALETAGFAMAYGAVFSLMLALAFGRSFVWDWTVDFTVAFVWLVLASTVLGVTCYIALIGRIGPDRAASANVLVPSLALGVSTVFEGYQWTALAGAGVVLALAGNVIVLARRREPSTGRPAAGS